MHPPAPSPAPAENRNASLFLNFSYEYACPEPVLANVQLQSMVPLRTIAYSSLNSMPSPISSRSGTYTRMKTIILFRAFFVSVPSLSWQMIVFHQNCVKRERQGEGAKLSFRDFAPGRRRRPSGGASGTF
jgi:hypothetical protein